MENCSPTGYQSSIVGEKQTKRQEHKDTRNTKQNKKQTFVTQKDKANTA